MELACCQDTVRERGVDRIGAVSGRRPSARVYWWWKALATQAGALRAVHGRLAQLADPPNYTRNPPRRAGRGSVRGALQRPSPSVGRSSRFNVLLPASGGSLRYGRRAFLLPRRGHDAGRPSNPLRPPLFSGSLRRLPAKESSALGPVTAPSRRARADHKAHRGGSAAALTTSQWSGWRRA